MSLRVRPWLPYGVQLLIPWTCHLSHFQFAHAFSCSLIQIPLLICAVVHCDTLKICCYSQLFTQRWYAKYMEWICRGAFPHVGSVAIEKTPEVCITCWWYCTVSAPKLHLILCAQEKFSSAHEKCHFCVSGVHTSSVQRHESWAWNHNLLLGGT